MVGPWRALLRMTPNLPVASDKASNSFALSVPSALSSLALFFCCTVWLPSAVVAILLLLNLSSRYSAGAVAVAILLGLLWRFLFRDLSRREFSLLLAGTLACILLAAMFSIFFYDTMSDSRAYHSDAILALLHGSNPVYGLMPAIVVIPANYYPKGTWYFAALVIHAFGNFQLGKIYNFLLMFSCFAYAGSSFYRWGLRGRSLFPVAAAVAFSPVAVSQMTTYYADGAIASLLALVVMANVNRAFCPARYDRSIYILSGSLAIAIKYSCGAYIVAASLVLVAVRVLYRRHAGGELRRALSKDLVDFAAVLFLGVIVLGYSPYVTNIRHGLHPLYPLMGRGKVDIMTGNTPPALLNPEYNRFKQVLYSVLWPNPIGYKRAKCIEDPVHREEAGTDQLG